MQAIDVAAILANRPDLTLRSGLSVKESNALTVILSGFNSNRTNAIFSLFKTLFVCFMLIVLIQLFSKDINTLLIEPIEGMMEKLMLMAKDPESAAKQ